MKKILLMVLMSVVITSVHAQNRKLKITIGNSVFTATLNNNETVDAFVDMLPINIPMNEMGGYEKFHYLSRNMPGAAVNVGTTYEGDLMIWSGNCLVLFYVTRSTTYSYIRIGRIDNTSGLQQAVGSGNVQVTFELENSASGINDTGTNEDKYAIITKPGLLQVSGCFEKLCLFNINGSMITQTTENIIDTGNLSAGIYLLRIETGDGKSIIRYVPNF